MTAAVLVAAALASTPGLAGIHHEGVVRGEVVEWTSSWHSPDRCVELAGPFEPPAPYTVEVRGETPWLCRAERDPWTLSYDRPFPSDSLGVPLVARELQRIDVRGARFESADGAVRKHLKVWSATGIHRKDRRALDAMLPTTRGGTRVYVAPRSGHPVAGALQPPGASRAALYGALGIFVFLGVTLVLAHRVLERGARRERLQRWLAAEAPTQVDS